MILIKNSRIIDPARKLDLEGYLILDGTKIKTVGEGQADLPESAFEQVIDAAGRIAAPGLIDVHTHFRDPGATHKEDLHTGTRAAIAGGFTSVVCMANTIPVVDQADVLRDILKRAEQEPIHIYQSAAISKKFQGKELTDFGALIRAGATGFTDDGIPLLDEAFVRRAMQEAVRYDVPLSFHEEDPSLIGNPGVHAGAVAKRLGLRGAPSESEEVLVERDCRLALETGARVQIQHISSAGSVAIVREAKKKGAHVTAEVTPHHFSLTEDAVLRHGTLAKMNPPLRTEKDRLALIEALRDGTIDMIATDHAPHAPWEKETEQFTQAPSGIIGLETSLALGITNLVRPGYLSLTELLEKMTVNPAKLYGLPAGSLREGAAADIVLIDPEKKWTVTEFQSKSSNSPFLGETLYGKAEHTICSGKLLL